MKEEKKSLKLTSPFWQLMMSQWNKNKDRTSSLNKKDTQIGAKGMANRASTSQYKQEIATNTSNLHLTSRVWVELESSLQGHLKAFSQLTRGIERANHHPDLLHAAIDSKRPPKGLIPKVTPRIPDTPGTFTIEWEDSLQKAGLILAEKLRDYWKDRSRRLEQEYSPILTNLKSLTK